MIRLTGLLTLLVAFTLISCGGSGDDNNSTNGQLSVGVTDGPVDNASAVVVAFNSISVKPQDGPAIDISLDETLQIDLLQYQGEARAMLLEGFTLEAGTYNWVRLGVVEADSYIEVDGQQYALEIPSGAQTGLKLNRGFTVAAGALTDFTIDFDLRKSVHQEGTGDYKLRPTLRILDTLEVGSISGSIEAGLIMDVACNNGDNNDAGNAVYLFEGSDQSPQDVQGNDGDPLASAAVSYVSETDSYDYTIGFVGAGDYTVAFTCDATLDEPAEDNSVEVIFSTPMNISVTANAETTADFSVPTI